MSRFRSPGDHRLMDAALSSTGPCRHEERNALLEKVAKCAEIFADSHNYREQWRHDDALYALRVALRAALAAAKEGK